MRRERLIEALVAEAYAATSFGNPPTIMDPRRVKRLASIVQGSAHDDAETINRLAGAHHESRLERKAIRALRALERTEKRWLQQERNAAITRALTGSQSHD